MRQFFECSNFECSHKTSEYPNMRMKDLYSKIKENGEAEVSISPEKEEITCPKCFAEMVYVSLSGEPGKGTVSNTNDKAEK